MMELVYRSLAGELDETDTIALNAWLDEAEERRNWYLALQQTDLLSALLSEQAPVRVDRLLRDTYEHIQQATGISSSFESTAAIVRPIRSRNYYAKWWRVAVIILILGAGAYLYNANKSPAPVPENKDQTALTDIPPGSNKAVLTLSDGTTIALDSAADGRLATQGEANVIKLANGEIRYDIEGVAQKSSLMNQMRTPRGGQYRLILPDGSKVLLNAASSITYPAVFVGNERKVKITGEAYLEIARNKSKPFIVDIDGKSTVEVLGTQFNVNAYDDEGSVNTTLVEGSVKVNGTTIKPGQQAVVKDTDVTSVVNNCDLEKVLAWKNGLFSFNNTDLVSVMRQLERWYDVKVVYQRDVADLTLRGEMYRNVKLSTIVSFLKKMGVNVRMEGKTLIVL